LILRANTDPGINHRARVRVATACAASILALSGCTQAERAPEPKPPEANLEQVRFRAWRGADLAASGTAASATFRRDNGTVRALDARVDVPRPGEPAVAATAPVLSGDTRARSWRGEGGVVLTRGDVEARTASARFAEGDGSVRGDEPVVVAGPGWRLSGPAFTADPRTGDVEIHGGARLVADGVRP